LRAIVPAGSVEKLDAMRDLLKQRNLNSVCQAAHCPNIAKCFSEGTVTFMIMGNVCTRNCRFCAVEKGHPVKLDSEEPFQIAEAVEALKLRHVVITSVTRDDLSDGGASHFAEVVRQIRRRNNSTVIELLIPDFQGSLEALEEIIDSNPDIIGHNIETVKRIFGNVRPIASFEQSIDVLRLIRKKTDSILSKSGFMVGLGETKKEVLELLSILRDCRCDMITIGQYLRPSALQVPMVEYVHPSQFEYYQEKALALGFEAVLSGPLVRSSFNASSLYEKIEGCRHDAVRCV